MNNIEIVVVLNRFCEIKTIVIFLAKLAVVGK